MGAKRVVIVMASVGSRTMGLVVRRVQGVTNMARPITLAELQDDAWFDMLPIQSGRPQEGRFSKLSKWAMKGPAPAILRITDDHHGKAKAPVKKVRVFQLTVRDVRASQDVVTGMSSN